MRYEGNIVTCLVDRQLSVSAMDGDGGSSSFWYLHDSPVWVLHARGEVR